MKTAIINYGLGNLRSVANAVEALGHEAFIAHRPDMLQTADRIILPGVGAFADGMRKLVDGGWTEPLETQVRRDGKPFLGLCLGMQLLASSGTEHGTNDGLGWIPGHGGPAPWRGWHEDSPCWLERRRGSSAATVSTPTCPTRASSTLFTAMSSGRTIPRSLLESVTTVGSSLRALRAATSSPRSSIRRRARRPGWPCSNAFFALKCLSVLKNRLIPVLLLQNGLLVRSELFKIHQVIGNPIHEVQRFNEWNVDELIYLDITRGDSYDLRRDDHKVARAWRSACRSSTP